jgi:hypothetical protein
VFKSTALTRLRTFRQQLYAGLGLRQDSLFELLDSALSSPDRRTLVRLSLNSIFRRRWPGTCDALADGTLDPSALRRLFLQSLPPVDSRPLLRSEGLHPVEDRPVRDIDATLGQQLQDLPAGERVGQVPAHRRRAHVGRPAVATAG